MSTDKTADTTAISKRPLEMGESGLELKTLDDAWRFGQYVIASGMASKSYTKPEQVIIAIQRGAEVGLKPLQALDSIAVINGRATMWGDGVLGLLWGSGLLEDFEEWYENDTAFCRMKRKDVPTPITRSFSKDDARKAGLIGKQGPWSQYERRMQQMRARSWAARDGFADVLRGLHVREEVQDYAAEPPQARQSVTLTADGRIESPEPAADAVDVEADPVAVKELF